MLPVQTTDYRLQNLMIKFGEHTPSVDFLFQASIPQSSEPGPWRKQSIMTKCPALGFVALEPNGRHMRIPAWKYEEMPFFSLGIDRKLPLLHERQRRCVHCFTVQAGFRLRLPQNRQSSANVIGTPNHYDYPEVRSACCGP